MARLSFYALWSLRDAPRQFSSKAKRGCFQVHVPLPLPEQLVIFGLGEWKHSETTLSVEVVVSADVPAQLIGTLSPQVRCLTWEGDWTSDMVAAAAQRGRKGVYGKILLTVCGQPRDSAGALAAQREPLFAERDDAADLSGALLRGSPTELASSNVSRLSESVCSAEIQVNRIDASDAAVGVASQLWPTDKAPRCTVIGRRGHPRWSADDAGGLPGDAGRASTPKKRRRLRLDYQEAMAARIKSGEREVSACPSRRWSHTMVLSDPETAVLIGGETTDGDRCEDSLWKLELDGDFWFPLNSSAAEPVPLCARGHTATYDPASKEVFVYGGRREGQRRSELYVLSTLTWKWRLVTAKGSVPNLTHHSAAFYKKELFVFGGVQPSHSPGGEKCCSNALYIFNPEFELWYQPIVEGDWPLPRFGHSATLLSHKLIIFGGRKTATYLNDLHVLDLGFMEYTAVKSGNMPPLPRGFHAALPVSDNRVLVSGGCSAIGALQDAHVFNVDTSTWSSVACPPLCLKPRAGHSVVHLGGGEPGGSDGIRCALLVFGGSDCAGTFYDDALKCSVDIPGDE